MLGTVPLEWHIFILRRNKDKRNNRSAAELGVDTRKEHEEIVLCKTKESKAGSENSSRIEGSFQSQQRLKTCFQNDSSQGVSLANDDSLSAKSLLLSDADHVSFVSSEQQTKSMPVLDMSGRPETPQDVFNESKSDDIYCGCSHCPCGATVIRPDNKIQSLDEKQPADEYKSTFKLIIHRNEDFIMRLGKLDTGATVNAVSNTVVSALDMQTEVYDGPSIDPVGKTFKPDRKVTFNWHVSQFPKTYTNEFLVIPDEISEGFDILLGDSTIKEIGFYKRNGKIFLLDSTI